MPFRGSFPFIRKDARLAQQMGSRLQSRPFQSLTNLSFKVDGKPASDKIASFRAFIYLKQSLEGNTHVEVIDCNHSSTLELIKAHVSWSRDSDEEW